MRRVGGLARGGQLVFTYIHAGVLDGTIHFDSAAAVMRMANHSGKPWIFGLQPRLVPTYLRERGLYMMDDLGADDYRLKAMGPRARRIKGYAFYTPLVRRPSAARSDRMHRRWRRIESGERQTRCLYDSASG
jgi:hypothetical protein